jgi:Regulator of chromosome condensation (RCC1) repeat
VFTWGCSDNGSLGRSGDEYTPLLVQVSDAMRNSEEVVDMIDCSAEYCSTSPQCLEFNASSSSYLLSYYITIVT